MSQLHEFDVATERLRVHVRAASAEATGDGAAGWAQRTAGQPAVVLVHGNCSSSAFFHRLLGQLPPRDREHPQRPARVGQGTMGDDIVFRGVPCSPGDIAYADEDGVVLLPAPH